MSDFIRAESIRVMHPLFHAGEGGSIPTSALQLHFAKCDMETAMQLNRLWHSRLPRTVAANLLRVTNNAFFAADFDGIYYAAAIWTSPSARLLPQKTWLELKRFAIAPDRPRNTASRMLSWMTREIQKTIPTIERLISYQDCDVHTGSIYRAAGWTATVKSFDHRNRGLRSGRVRNMSQTTATKQRWEKILKVG